MYYTSDTDDTTRYLCRQNCAKAIEFLELTIHNIFTCFKQNRLVANSDRSSFLISPYEKISLKILDSIAKSSLCKGLLGITSDTELIFHKHIMLLSSKADQNISVFTRIVKYLNTDKRKNLFNMDVSQ